MIRMKTLFLVSLLAFAAWLLAAPAGAAVFCVTTSAELQQALDTAATNGEANEIQVHSGSYAVPVDGFVYSAVEPGGHNQDLTISGGWSAGQTPLPPGSCVVRDPSPLATWLVGSEGNRVMLILPREAGTVTVRGLTFIHGEPDSIGGGLYVFAASTSPLGDITIESNLFLSNQGQLGAGLSVRSRGIDGARLRVINNAFFDNHSVGTSGGAAYLDFSPPMGGLGSVDVLVANNTIFANTTEDPDTFGAAGGLVAGPPRGELLLANNNLSGNQGADLRVSAWVGTSGYLLYRNNIGERSGIEPHEMVGNLSVEPEFLDCGSACPAWVPVVNSPLVRGGMLPPQGAQWYLTNFDLLGNPRVNAGRVDIGAYENQDGIFSDRYQQ